VVEFTECILGILGNIHQDRTWPTCTGNMKSLGNGRGYVFHPSHLYVPLGSRHRKPYHISFLKSISSEEPGVDLTCNAHQWGTVYHGVSQAGDKIGCTGARSNHAYSHFPRNPCITLCRMDCALLVTRKDMLYMIDIIEQCVINRHDGASWITK